jgi:mxaA protein
MVATPAKIRFSAVSAPPFPANRTSPKVERAVHFAGLLVFALTAAPPLFGKEPAPTLEIAAPRDYGFVMGDIVETAVSVSVPENYALEAGFLPKPGTLDEWLDVRSVAWDRESSNGRALYRIHLAYQVFKGVRSPAKATIPELPIRFAGAAPLEVKAPALDFTIVPLIPPDLPDEKVASRPAAPPESEATEAHFRRLVLCLAGAFVAGSWLAWHRLGPARRARPFAEARRDMKLLLQGSASPKNFRAAARRLHRALDASFGGTLFAGQIDRFCAEKPSFAGLRDELADFFALSQELFFTSPESSVPADYPPERLAELCRRLASAEGRQA